ncbi:IGHMBP2 family helicase [Flaviaesturariibacter flavus]|uniref:IGHMBP2 family helicase n=1 Tax=Flaviaesturariibacter flavus TaxID=2502780 RepID=A0A4R1BB52_9BACT|nr:AAA domain-containing protein [Flaviaesturariibacter flavus]TCJ14209.1 IGHMBP2 family helicase [Flaviaesturariibacter flavus]
MDYFKELTRLLQLEKDEDRAAWEAMARSVPLNDRRANGSTWFPVAIRDTEAGYGDYLSIEVERTTAQDVIHQFRFGASVALFSNHDAASDRLPGVISNLRGDRMKISLRVDELPDWTRDGRLGVDLVFDENSYEEMERALRIAPERLEQREEGALARVLTGTQAPTFNERLPFQPAHRLNEMQNEAVRKILSANELAIVHGPPGTGKTTTLVEAIARIARGEEGPVLVTAPSNAAVDLLSEKLAAEGLNVVRVGNPARVSEALLALTLDERMQAHPQMKEIRRMKKQASEYRDLAHKYKRSFGAAEREQRKALFNEARAIGKEIERTEGYIASSVLDRAQVITATLVGAAHQSVRSLRYGTVVIDEAGQALEPACWIPVLKGKRLIMAGDHCQLPPTVKSEAAARDGLTRTLMERCVGRYPEAVVLLEEQYRMHDTIMRFSSKEFYEDRLKAAPAVAGHLLFAGDRPFTFIDTAGTGYEEKVEGTRISNPEEAVFLLQQVTRLLSELPAGTPPPRIGVISPYRHQVELLRELAAAQPALKELGDALTVNTIDSFQGQERDAIFISLARSNADNVIGFLSEVRRMNVAMTRARKKLVLAGDSATLGQYPFYADLIAYAQEQDAYISAWELMEF